MANSTNYSILKTIDEFKAIQQGEQKSRLHALSGLYSKKEKLEIIIINNNEIYTQLVSLPDFMIKRIIDYRIIGKLIETKAGITNVSFQIDTEFLEMMADSTEGFFNFFLEDYYIDHRIKSFERKLQETSFDRESREEMLKNKLKALTDIPDHFFSFFHEGSDYKPAFKIAKSQDINGCLYFVENGSIKDLNKNKIYIDWLKFRGSIAVSKYIKKELAKIKNSQKSTHQVTQTGFKTDLSEAEIKALYKKLRGDYIHQDTKQKNFEAVFSDKQKGTINPIVWIKLGRNRLPSKIGLIDFLEVFTKSNRNQKDFDDKVSAYFRQLKKDKIEIIKFNAENKNREHSEFYDKLIAIKSSLPDT